MRPSSPTVFVLRFSLLSFQQTRHRHTYPSAAGLLSVPASTVARWHAGTPRQVSQKLIIAKGVGNYNCLRPAETNVIIQTLVSGAARASRKLGANSATIVRFQRRLLFPSKSTNLSRTKGEKIRSTIRSDPNDSTFLVRENSPEEKWGGKIKIKTKGDRVEIYVQVVNFFRLSRLLLGA